MGPFAKRSARCAHVATSQGQTMAFTQQDLEDCMMLAACYALALTNAQLQEANRKATEQTKVAVELMGPLRS